MKKMIRPKKRIIAFVTVILLSSSFSFAQNPLAALPSVPGPTVDSIKKLADNKWLNLGAPAADPKYGRARGRSWGGKGMVLIPDRRGAFLTGEGIHAYVKPDGYGMDDYWFYDINTHRWICLFPGTDTKNFNNRVKNGTIKLDSVAQVVNGNGEPIPGHLLIHAWGYIDYDTDRKKIVFHSGNSYGRYYLPGEAAIDSGLKVLEGKGMNTFAKPMSPWFYNTLTGKFEHYPITLRRPDVGGFPSSLYISSKKQFFLAGESGVAYFDPATDKWRKETVVGKAPAGYDFGACYDSKRDRVYMGQNADNFSWYDIKTSTWTKINCPQEYKLSFRTNDGSVSYDIENDMILIFNFTKNIIYPINPVDNSWGTPIPMDSKFSSTRRDTYCSFYDPTLAVHFIFTAGDSRDDAIIWTYRYKKSTFASVMNGTEGGLTLSAYPNPFNHATTIRVEGAHKLQSPVIEIFDMLGRIVHSEKTTSEKLRSGFTWTSGTLQNGIYLISVKDQTRSIVSRVVLMK